MAAEEDKKVYRLEVKRPSESDPNRTEIVNIATDYKWMDNKPLVFSSKDEFPEEGNSENLYIAVDEEMIYRWDKEEEDYFCLTNGLPSSQLPFISVDTCGGGNTFYPWLGLTWENTVAFKELCNKYKVTLKMYWKNKQGMFCNNNSHGFKDNWNLNELNLTGSHIHFNIDYNEVFKWTNFEDKDDYMPCNEVWFASTDSIRPASGMYKQINCRQNFIRELNDLEFVEVDEQKYFECYFVLEAKSRTNKKLFYSLPTQHIRLCLPYTPKWTTNIKFSSLRWDK